MFQWSSGRLRRLRAIRASIIAVSIAATMLGTRASATPIDVDEFGRWADQTFGSAYAKGDGFSGMGIVAVSHGRVVFERTYGLADHATGKLIDPAQTEFLIGSLSKTFLGIAIAQLVDQGRIKSIDDPANLYLTRTKLPGAWGAKVTIRDLLTHSAGYEQHNRDVGRHQDIPTPLSGQEIRRIAPPLVRPPGELVSYSNYSTGLLGVLIEDVTGLDMQTYLRGHVWGPLGMRSAHYDKSMTLEPNTIRAAARDKTGHWRPLPFIPFHPYYWPVGSISMTLNDAATYARYHLMAGRGEANPILSPAIYAQLHSIIRTDHPDVGGFGFQMMSYAWNGHRLYGHGGTWPNYESMLIVDPDDDFAVFFAIAGPKAIGNLNGHLMVVQHLFGAYDPGRPVIRLSQAQLDAYTGIYRSTLRADHTIEAALAFLGKGDGLAVTVAHGGLMVGTDGPFMPVGHDLFWDPKAKPSASNPFGSPVFGFVRDGAGHIRYMVHEEGMSPSERISPLLAPALRVTVRNILSFCLLLGLIAIFWPRQSRWDWLVKAAAILPAAGLFSFSPILTMGLGAGGLGAYVIEGRPGRFLALTVMADGVVACTIILIAASVTWLFPGAAARPLWVRAHVVLMALLALLASLLFWSMQLVGASA